MTMHFSYIDNDKRSKAAKFALIAGLHVAVGVLFVHSLNTRHVSLSKLQDQVLVLLQPDAPPPPPPPTPPMPMPQLAPPEVLVPKVEVEVAPPPDPSPVVATTVPDPQQAQPTQAVVAPTPQAPTTPPNANAGQMRSAVFADASGCALPAYPANAARNGDTGTTLLALLVGPDGRVSSARVQHTSGSTELDRAAVRALSLCKFKPATNNGVPESGWAQLAYVWKLD
jgi:protein TonB